MNPRVKEVRAQADYKVVLFFDNGESKLFDMRPYLDFGIFSELKDPEYFQRVRSVNGSIAWPHGQDVCPDTLYEEGRFLE